MPKYPTTFELIILIHPLFQLLGISLSPYKRRVCYSEHYHLCCHTMCFSCIRAAFGKKFGKLHLIIHSLQQMLTTQATSRTACLPYWKIGAFGSWFWNPSLAKNRFLEVSKELDLFWWLVSLEDYSMVTVCGILPGDLSDYFAGKHLRLNPIKVCV